MKKLLIVEGNLSEENNKFSAEGIQTHTESLKDSLNYYTKDLQFDVINPSSDKSLESTKNKLSIYDGLIWGGSSLNIYNDTPEIRRQIGFMKECLKKVRNILAICWGMQVAVTAAGGEVKKADDSHIGIANEIIINENGLTHPIYKDKEKIFNLLDTPGHQDFSEDTYRVLTAVDSAVMVLDGAQGIETQTKKLFEVCRLRDMPIATFINKMDRESKDPFDLIDEIEQTL